MRLSLAISFLVCFVGFRSCYCAKAIDSNSVDHLKGDEFPVPPQPTADPPPTPPTNGTTIKPPTPTTNGTTTTPKPSTTQVTTTTVAPPSTSSTKPPSSSSTTTAPSTSSPSPSPPSSSTTTSSPSPHPVTTPAPHPSERKFDAMSFLGGFALGLGLVAVGFLSWKFYASRRENYYHTL